MPIEIFSRVKDGAIPRVSHTENSSNIAFKYQKKDFKFVINKLWNNNEKNKEIFDTLYKRSQNHAHVYWLAFGYTGSGKTYTITGIMKELFETLNTMTIKKNVNQVNQVSSENLPSIQPQNVASNTPYIEVTAYQIYREKIYDMMNNNKLLQTWKTDKLVIKNLQKKRLENVDTMMSRIQKNRKMASTNMNNVSSRSHAIINIYCGSKCYTLVDMAGQESGVTSNKNERLVKKQGTSINLNMLALKECIRMYHDKKAHIPFRRTLLTLALKPLFIKQCYVSFICTISSAQNIFYQIDSIRYASALYDKDASKKDNNLNEFFKHYTKYVEEIGWVGFKERQIWRKMKFGYYEHAPKIFTYMKQRKSLMNGFSDLTKKYQNVLPNIKKKSQSKPQSSKQNIQNIQNIKEQREKYKKIKKNLFIRKKKQVNTKISKNVGNPLHILSPISKPKDKPIINDANIKLFSLNNNHVNNNNINNKNV